MSEITRANMQLELFLNRVGVETAEEGGRLSGRPYVALSRDIDPNEGEIIATFEINRRTGEISYTHLQAPLLNEESVIPEEPPLSPAP